MYNILIYYIFLVVRPVIIIYRTSGIMKCFHFDGTFGTIYYDSYSLPIVECFSAEYIISYLRFRYSINLLFYLINVKLPSPYARRVTVALAVKLRAPSVRISVLGTYTNQELIKNDGYYLLAVYENGNRVYRLT